MVGKKSIAVAFGVCLAAVYGTSILVGIHDNFPKISL